MSAANLSELDANWLDTLQRVASNLKIERDLLKLKLSKHIICQATFDEIDSQVENALQETQAAIQFILNVK